MAIVMVALLAFGGTYAYFTAEAGQEIDGNVVTATVQLTGGSKVTLSSTNKLLPGDEILAADSLQVTDASNVATWIFAKLTVTATRDDQPYTDWQYETGHEGEQPYSIAAGGFAAVAGNAGYYSAEGDGTAKAYKFGAIELNENLKGHSVDAEIGESMNVEFTIAVEYFSCQKDMGATAADALTAYLALGR